MILMQIATSLHHTFFCKLFRVLDLLVFSFSDCDGVPICSLHVLCYVNIYKEEKLLFSSNMLSYADEHENENEDIPYGFDLNMAPLTSKDRTQGDTAMVCINAELPIRVERTFINADGRIIFIAENNMKICITPDKKTNMEQWRLVILNQSNSNTRHIVYARGAIWEE